MLLTSILTVFWGLDKGLGLGDDGTYLLSARFPNEFRQTVTATYIYTGFLFKISNYDPMLFRLIGVFIVLASAFIFWLGFDNG